jgi:hypothetical protein
MKYLAYLIIFTGVAHIALGLGSMPQAAQDILRRGIIGSVTSDDSKRMLFLWYEAAGLAMVTIGAALAAMARMGANTVSWLFVASFFALTLFVVVLFPRGGAWLFFLEGLALVLLKALAK